MVDNQRCWFVARTRKDQELKVRERLKELDDELDVEFFLPTQTVIRQLKYRRKQVEVPVIRNLVFIRATKDIACALANEYGVRIFYVQDLTTHKMMVVPDKQMDDFMLVMDHGPEDISYEEIPFCVGEKVQIIKGKLCGVEGELVSKANRNYVVVRLHQLVSVTARVLKRDLRRI